VSLKHSNQIKSKNMKGGEHMKTLLTVCLVFLTSIAWAGADTDRERKIQIDIAIHGFTDTVAISAGTTVTVAFAPQGFARNVFSDLSIQPEFFAKDTKGREVKNKVFVLKMSDSQRAALTFITAGSFLVGARGTYKNLETSLAKVKVFPNPVRLKNGQGKITLAPVPKGAKIRIYDPSGLLIWEYDVETDTGAIDYDIKNNYGRTLASGIYFVAITIKGQKPCLKTITVIK